MTALVTVTGDGTFRAPAAPGDAPSGTEGVDALARLRSMLGDDLEDEIGTRLYLPAGLAPEPEGQLLPATLALLLATGDLTPQGWRIGPGEGRAWHRACELSDRLLEDARIALLGYEGPLALTALGPITLGAATFARGGERLMTDAGAMRDLPALLAEGIAARAGALAERVPGAQPWVVIREDAVRAVSAGRVPTASGRWRYPAVPAPEIGARWEAMVDALEHAGIPSARVVLGSSTEPSLIAAARSAGARRLAIMPSRLPAIGAPAGRTAWEALADAHESGIGLELIVPPAGSVRELGPLLGGWRELGFSAESLAGITLIGHPTADRGARASIDPARVRVGTPTDPAAEAVRSDLLDEAGITALLRAAPAWAESLSD